MAITVIVAAMSV